ncbi:MAG: undecaprenyl-phosphate glucose phosphotransferase [Candidatus Marinimicrobia bacterium]|nr:undecaprenyl-phosphate glucose phosphotransferase [Candidatus Neomarinimicrobiota bacterium]
MMNKKDKLLYYLYLSFDIFLIGINLILAHKIRGLGFDDTQNDKFILLFSIVSWFIITRILNYYYLYYNIGERIKKTFQVSILFFIAISTLGFFYKESGYSRLIFIYFTATITISVFIFHNIFNFFILRSRRYGKNVKRVLVIGAGRIASEISKEAELHPEYGNKIVGFLDDNKNSALVDKIIGKFSDLGRIVKEKNIDELIIALPLSNEKKIKKLITVADYEGVRTTFVPNIHHITNQYVQFGNFGKIPVFSFQEIPLDNIFNRIYKRTFDIIFSLFILIVASPVMLVIAIAIKLSSKGPVFFIQERTGYNQDNFKCYKFRSMRETSKEVSDSVQATKDDQRKTVIGNFLRKTNLDEFPQFLNVLKGDMSVVGPRPHMLIHTESFRNRVDEYMIRHFVKPGITGWAQVNGWRGPTDTLNKIQKRVEYDLWYNNNWTFMLDIEIIFKTIFSKRSHLNAY